jgi:hypothetical protein
METGWKTLQLVVFPKFFVHCTLRHARMMRKTGNVDFK